MKPAIFFDHMSSYHPLSCVVDILKKPLHPHALSSWIQNKDHLLKINAYKESIYLHLGMSQEDVLVLTPGGEAAAEQMLEHCYLEEIFHSGKQHVLMAAQDLPEKYTQLGVVSERLVPDSKGHLTQEILRSKITPRTALISFSWADPLTGLIQPVADIAQICKEQGICCHIDISHVIGKLYFKLADLPFDYVTFDAKAFHGPFSVGGLIMRSNAPQSKEHILELEALEAALAHANSHIDEMNLEVTRLRNSFEEQLLAMISGSEVLCLDVERLSHVSVITFPYVHSEYLLYLLTQDRLYASIGGGEYPLLTTLLEHRGIGAVPAQCALSFSFSYGTTQEEVDNAVERISKRYQQARLLVERIS